MVRRKIHIVRRKIHMFGANRRLTSYHKGLTALLFYVLVWTCSIAYAATETTNSWSLGQVLILSGIFSSIITGLIGYTYNSNINSLKELLRLDREAAEKRIDKLFDELKAKKDRVDCKNEMDKIGG